VGHPSRKEFWLVDMVMMHSHGRTIGDLDMDGFPGGGIWQVFEFGCLAEMHTSLAL